MRSLFEDWIERLCEVQGRRYCRDQTLDSLALLVRQARQFAPTRIVELGTSWGLSLRAFVHAATGADIVTVDVAGLGAVQAGFDACPFDLSSVMAIKADVRDLVATDLWQADDRVLLYCDVHGESVARHLTSELIPRLPAGSLVMVDDVWASDFDFSDQDGFERFFDQRIADEVDPDQPHNYPTCWRRYWGTGRPVAGFAEIAELMQFVNRRRIDCRFETKVMRFYVSTEPMTIFATCKPFCGHTKTIQINAITSWTLLQPRPEIIILGNDDGASKTATMLGACHEPTLDPLTNPPRVDVIFAAGERAASNRLLVYVNADIILGQRFILAAQAVNRSFGGPFLMTGLRWDLMNWQDLNVGCHGWRERLEQQMTAFAEFHRSTGADYFVFRRGLYPEIPPFYIGHSAWDNWLIMDIVRAGLPVVDATPFVQAVHHGLERCDVTDPRYKVNQAIWTALNPQHGEGMIESAGWIVGPKGEVMQK